MILKLSGKAVNRKTAKMSHVCFGASLRIARYMKIRVIEEYIRKIGQEPIRRVLVMSPMNIINGSVSRSRI